MTTSPQSAPFDNPAHTQTLGDILVVDDTLPNLRLLTSMLQKHGYSTRGVPNGEMALTVVQADPPDLILLDINMPNLDGYEVCRQLKQIPATQDIPVLFISALDETADKIRGFAVGGVDYITKPFQMEEVLARVQTHLALCRLHQTNLAQIAALRQSNAELDAFAHTVAHDLKNPLTNLQLYADIVQRQLSTDDDPTLVRGMRHIVENAARMGRIMEALLLLSGVRRQQVALAPLNMAQIVEQAQQRLQIQAQAAKADIYLPSVWPTAVGYAPWVEEIWYNYLSNGLKYGGPEPSLELGVTLLPDDRASFWVQDTGPGIATHMQDRLFAEFSRLSQERPDGHGLGLAIVQRIMTRLGGEAGVESRPGAGSRFYFILPLA